MTEMTPIAAETAQTVEGAPLLSTPAAAAASTAPVQPEREALPVAGDVLPSAEEADAMDPVWAWLNKNHPDIQALPEGFSLSTQGVYQLDDAPNRNSRVKGRLFVCSPLVVIGRTRTDKGGAGWGYLVALLNPAEKWVPVIVPSSMLADDGRQMRELLMRQGLRCAQDRAGRQAMGEYIQSSSTSRTVQVVTRPGWVGNQFLLPELLLPEETEGAASVMLDMEGREHLFRQDGTLKGWQLLARRAEANSRAALALSAAFAGPLLTRLGEPGGGLHFHATSSRGKTTMLRLAGSVWGGGGELGFAQSWRTTDSALEGTAVNHNDTLLCIDEIGLAPTDRLGEICYMLASGQGKARATTTGRVQPTARWRTLVLSSGEDPIAARIASSATFRRSGVQAGTTVRMVDLPMLIDDETSFEDLSGFADERAFTGYLLDETDRHYGRAGPAFVEEFLVNPEAHEATAREMIKAFIAQITTPEDDPQVQRVARQFAVIAAAGALACRWGVLPWDRETSAFEAAATCFAAWKAGRDTTKSAEELDAIRTLKAFFELHGASRFESLERQAPYGPAGEDDPLSSSSSQIVRDRCGYRLENEEDDGITYFVTPEAWRTQICADRDAEFVARVALKCGALTPGENGRLTKNKRLPGHAGTTRVYCLRPDKLP